MSVIHKVKGVIFDIGGTLVLNNHPLPGAIKAVSTLRNAGVLLCFVTNTTDSVVEAGVEWHREEQFNAVITTDLEKTGCF